VTSPRATPSRAAPGTRGEPGQRLVVPALLALAFLLGCFPMGDFDVWWHLRTGQLILEQGAVPRVDVFTYTNADRPWIDLYWLFQVGLAVLYRVGGASALVLAKAAGGTAIVALSLAARQKDSRAWPAVVVWLPALVMLSGRLCERPELASLFLLAGFLFVLGRAADKPRLLWLLPAAQVLWVNCHGFFVLGLLVLAAYLAGLAIERIRKGAAPVPQPPWKILAPASIATLLACLVNPYGVDAMKLPLEQFAKLGSAGVYRVNIGELKTVGDFVATAPVTNPYLLAFFSVLGLGVGSFVWLARRGRVPFFRIVLFLVAAYLGWQATRNSALFAVVVAFVTIWNLDDAVASTAASMDRPTSEQSRRRQRRPVPRAPRDLALLAAIAVWAILTASGALYAWAGERRTIGFGERKQWYAHDACAFLARPELPARIIAFNLGQAAVCIAHAAPAHKQFMDPRLEVNAQETFERYLAGLRKLWRGEPGWEMPLGVDHERTAELPAILIERGVLGRAARNLSRDRRWRCVFADEVATVFVASGFADAHGLAERKF
jgi:hypothetical protein